MTTTASAAPALPTSDALDFLCRLSRSSLQPPEALDALRGLRASCPGVGLRLVWQREEYDGSLHYDLLITRPGEGTVSLSYCPADGLPWPLRGGHRASEKLLLRVNGVEMEVGDALACLDFLWDPHPTATALSGQLPLAERLVTACLVRQEVEAAPQDPAALDGAELQAAMDAFRRARGLLTAAATTQWLDRRCLSHRDLEELVAHEAAVRRLRRQVTDARGYFTEHRHHFDTAHLNRVVFARREDAVRLVEEVRSGGGFHAALERAVLDGRVPLPAGLFCAVRRAELDTDVARAVFAARPGSTLGPFDAGTGHTVLRLLAHRPAEFDRATADLVERQLFARWLDGLRRTARIEWFWGNPARTATRRPE